MDQELVHGSLSWNDAGRLVALGAAVATSTGRLAGAADSQSTRRGGTSGRLREGLIRPRLRPTDPHETWRPIGARLRLNRGDELDLGGEPLAATCVVVALNETE